MDADKKWYIGPETGSVNRGVEANSNAICVEETVGVDWFEYSGVLTGWTEPENFQIKCIDGIHCSCKTLHISGFQYQTSRNGHYVISNSTLNGRKCFFETLKVILYDSYSLVYKKF